MTENEIFEQIKSILVERLGVDEESVTPETTFKDDLGADSLDIVELVMELEDTFDTEISDEAAESLTTVGKVVSYIQEIQ